MVFYIVLLSEVNNLGSLSRIEKQVICLSICHNECLILNVRGGHAPPAKATLPEDDTASVTEEAGENVV